MLCLSRHRDEIILNRLRFNKTFCKLVMLVITLDSFDTKRLPIVMLHSPAIFSIQHYVLRSLLRSHNQMQNCDRIDQNIDDAYILSYHAKMS